MQPQASFLITISRQWGSGGVYLGQRLAARLGAHYADREILQRVAQKLGTTEEVLERREESVTPFWQSLMRSLAGGGGGAALVGTPYPPYPLYVPVSLPDDPTDSRLYEAQSVILEHLTQQGPVVIVGRGGYWVLREHPRRLDVFLHAPPDFRRQRLAELAAVPAEEARRRLEASDRDRAAYLKALTGGTWTDARQFHLALNTSVLGLATCEEIIVSALRARLGEED